MKGGNLNYLHDIPPVGKYYPRENLSDTHNSICQNIESELATLSCLARNTLSF